MLVAKPKPLPYQVSKLQRTTVLLEVDELRELFDHLQNKLGDLYFYRVGALVEKSQLAFSEVLALYQEVLTGIKEGNLSSSISWAVSRDPNTLYKIEVAGGEIAKLYKPSLQILSGSICYLPELQTFKEKIYGKEVIPWGLQFVYPQLFQEYETHQVYNALIACDNGIVFKEVQRWLRAHTHPTIFSTSQGEVKTPFRLGPACHSWICNHPQLKETNLSIFMKN